MNIGVIGRGAAVKHKTGELTFQEKDLKFIEKLSAYFNRVEYAPITYTPESKDYKLLKEVYIKKLIGKNIEISPLFIEDNFKYFKILRKRWYQLKSIGAINKFLNKVDIVLIFLPSTISLLTILLCKVKGKEFAVYQGGSWAGENPKRGKIRIRSLKIFFGRLIENFIHSISEMVFVRGGIKKKNFYYIKGNSKFTVKDLYVKKGNFGGKEIVILNIASVNPLKGVDIIVKSIKILIKRGYNILFYQVGSYYHENYVRMSALIKSLDLQDRVEFFGYIHDKEKIKKIMRKSDIFVLASYMEGFPRVIVEAMSQSLPIIATPVGGIKELLKDGENVLFFKRGDPVELSNRIEQIINDDKLRDNLIKKGLVFAEKDLGMADPAEFIAGKLIDFFKKNNVKK